MSNYYYYTRISMSIYILIYCTTDIAVYMANNVSVICIWMKLLVFYFSNDVCMCIHADEIDRITYDCLCAIGGFLTTLFFFPSI